MSKRKVLDFFSPLGPTGPIESTSKKQMVTMIECMQRNMRTAVRQNMPTKQLIAHMELNLAQMLSAAKSLQD